MAAGLLSEWLPSTFHLVHDLRQRGVFHFIERETMRLEWSVHAQEVSHSIGIPPRFVVGRIIEHVARSDEPAIGQLKARACHSWWTIKSRGSGLFDRNRHERAVVRPAHPSFDDPGVSERF